MRLDGLEQKIHRAGAVALKNALPLANASLLDEGTAAAEAMHMAQAMAPGERTVFVIAADRSPVRLGRLAQNLARLDARSVSPIAMDASMPAVAPLDAILLDVPCTGTGTFRRHPDARWRLRRSDLALLAASQAELLRAAADCVKPGGLLVYSTCSLEPEENDEQIDAFLSQQPEWTLEPPPSGAVPDTVLDRGRLRVLPQNHGTDGSFAARLRRRA